MYAEILLWDMLIAAAYQFSVLIALRVVSVCLRHMPQFIHFAMHFAEPHKKGKPMNRKSYSVVTAMLIAAAIAAAGQSSSATSLRNENTSILGEAQMSRIPNGLDKARQRRQLHAACRDAGDSCSFGSDCCSGRCIDMSSLGKGCGF
jgi:hypothetical protein